MIRTNVFIYACCWESKADKEEQNFNLRTNPTAQPHLLFSNFTPNSNRTNYPTRRSSPARQSSLLNESFRQSNEPHLSNTQMRQVNNPTLKEIVPLSTQLISKTVSPITSARSNEL